VGHAEETSKKLITRKDRPGHDLRYATRCKINKELGWKPSVTFEQGLEKENRQLVFG
jgi:dTDP-glucose 4,6-dehydratase